ncbi:MAGa4850 family ICE element protein [Mycoplasma zalophi]|uniref:MAGa4850 family ICE element protein n=1 Tax=Mycoplasma zalophi TaxID=191287 RepID=UPI001C117AE5|nr:hypothetical protein [Mycoplasma zalophi]MBU4690841.1 hypothetical protein [Mycoplasma zalophi]
MENECDYKSIKDFYNNLNFENKYNQKKYDKQNLDHIRKFIKSGKLVISESWKNKLSGDLVLLKIFITIRIYRNSNINLSKNDLISELGFKKSTVNLAIKKMVDLNILDEAFLKEKNLLKLKKINLRKKGEIYVVIKGGNAMKILLLLGLKSAWWFTIEKFKSKALFGKKFSSHKLSQKIVLQNNFKSERYLILKF